MLLRGRTQQTVMPKRVYLDTSHQHWLSEWAVAEPEAFAAFVERWRAAGCLLVVTSIHLMEVRRHRDPIVRKKRWDLFEAMAPIVTNTSEDPDEHDAPFLLTHREILNALRFMGAASGSTPEANA